MTQQQRLSSKQIKEGGVHYTPPELAKFLAKNVLAHLAKDTEFKVLDPACGDGELLGALALQLSKESRKRCILYGMENDATALQQTQSRLQAITDCPRFELIHADFIQWIKDFSQPGIFSPSASPDKFDAIIANPPYVRTQVMGSRHARNLALHFGLTGRVDLYQAFAFAMTKALKVGGVMGLLCSNRFLSIQSGVSLRHILLNEYELHDIFDLGDTKLFAAAVLPAIVIGVKNDQIARQNCSFIRIYETKPGKKYVTFTSILEAVEEGAVGKVKVGGSVYEIERGELAQPASSAEPWRSSTLKQNRWLAAVHSNAPLKFADLVKIRVGIKTTADNVFIRSDWDNLPTELQPEPEVLRPVIARDVAAPWFAALPQQPRKVLYTHTIEEGKRVPIDIDLLPRAKRYLEHHKKQLTNRKYVIESGRKWYEIWVPQDPDSWHKPKVVFPDITASPKFFLDETSSVVDGNCYWFTSEHKDYLYLLLAIANSSFIVPYYDVTCGNRLYAGRRRFLTQYVQKFPVPKLDTVLTQDIIGTAKKICQNTTGGDELSNSIAQVDEMVWEAFGLSRKKLATREFVTSH